MHEMGAQLSWWWILPFAGLLLCIAVLPLATAEWFERHRNKALVAVVFGVPTVIYLLIGFGDLGLEQVLTVAEDYFSFIVLLAALFTITGGIYITGNLLATPFTNTVFMIIGALIASLIGTTGAAMLLVRPLLRANSERRHTKHIFVFAIFVICNLGGLLTPLGDPPLFLGFLNGVDFTWTLRLWPQWLVANAFVILIFFLYDSWVYRREETLEEKRLDVVDYEALGVKGALNIVFLIGVVVTVAGSVQLRAIGDALHIPFLREIIMLTLLLLSLRLGSQEGRRLNRFTWAPIREVGIIFAGIFAAMIPALALLEAHGGELGLTQPWHFFWASGGLSSVLDNAPTYLAFTSAALGYLGLDGNVGSLMSPTATAAGLVPAAFLIAISCGTVFMGAITYIGNAPNFMVKSMAEEQGIKMPSFFGYMAYSCLILVPLFVVLTLVFFV
jgi:Na+/H+ antiporter NhaD/arsenite permease-like protein